MRKTYIRIIVFFWAMGCSLLVLKTYTILQNTLAHNGRWISMKASLAKPPMGARSYVEGTQALAHERLDLSAYFGFQWVYTKEILKQVRQIDADITIQNQAYVYVVFNKVEDTFSALRLSVNPSYDSAYVQAKVSGEFIRKTPLSFAINPNTLYHIHLQENHLGLIDVFLNSKHVLTLSEGFLPLQRIGFWGSYSPVYIDTVRVLDRDARTIFSEDFSYSDPYRYIELSGLFLLSLITVRCFVHTVEKYRKIVGIIIGIVSVSTITAVIGSWYISDKYFPTTGIFAKQAASIVEKEKRTAIAGLNASISHYPPTQNIRILFLGSSQTSGAGAQREGDDYVAQVQKMLSDRSVECINLGLSAVNSVDIYEQYHTTWFPSLKPNVIVIDLSNNDNGAPDKFETYLRKIIAVGGADVLPVFVLEPVSPEECPEEFETHKRMRKIAQEYSVPLIDLNAYMKQQGSRGILWWDYVHPTSYGHFLMAEYITQQLETILVQRDLLPQMK